MDGGEEGGPEDEGAAEPEGEGGGEEDAAAAEEEERGGPRDVGKVAGEAERRDADELEAPGDDGGGPEEARAAAAAAASAPASASEEPAALGLSASTMETRHPPLPASRADRVDPPGPITFPTCSP